MKSKNEKNKESINKMIIMPAAYSTILCLTMDKKKEIMVLSKPGSKRDLINVLASAFVSDHSLAMSCMIALDLVREKLTGEGKPFKEQKESKG